MSSRSSLLQTLIPNISLTLILTGCFAGSLASTRYITNPSPASDLAMTAATADMEVKLHHVIFPDGPGSWVRGAKWDEFVLTIQNLKQQDVSIAGISLIDSRGVYVEPRPYILVQELDPPPSEVMQKGMEDVPASAVTGVARQALMEGLLSTLPMGALVGPMGYGVQGLLGVASAYPTYSQSQLEIKDKETIQAALKKRQLQVPATLSEGGALTGSVFFSPVQKPQALIIKYWNQQAGGVAGADGISRIRIPLDGISRPPATTQAVQQP